MGVTQAQLGQPAGVIPTILQHIVDVLCAPTTKLYNACLWLREIPPDWRAAKVVIMYISVLRGQTGKC